MGAKEASTTNYKIHDQDIVKWKILKMMVSLREIASQAEELQLQLQLELYDKYSINPSSPGMVDLDRKVIRVQSVKDK